MKHYILNGRERGCYDCGKQYLQCACYNKPKAIVNETPVFQVGGIVHVTYCDKMETVEIVAVRYPVYTNSTSWNGAPVIVTDYEVLLPDKSTEWFSQRRLARLDKPETNNV